MTLMVDVIVGAVYARRVGTKNFADATYEPSDEDLAQLMREAFAGVREANERALESIRAQIAARRLEVLARLRLELVADQ